MGVEIPTGVDDVHLSLELAAQPEGLSWKSGSYTGEDFFSCSEGILIRTQYLLRDLCRCHLHSVPGLRQGKKWEKACASQRQLWLDPGSGLHLP